MPNQPHNTRGSQSRHSYLPLKIKVQTVVVSQEHQFSVFSQKRLIVVAIAKSYEIMSKSCSESICVVWCIGYPVCVSVNPRHMHGTRDTKSLRCFQNQILICSCRSRPVLQ